MALIIEVKDSGSNSKDMSDPLKFFLASQYTGGRKIGAQCIWFRFRMQLGTKKYNLCFENSSGMVTGERSINTRELHPILHYTSLHPVEQDEVKKKSHLESNCF